MVLLTRGRDVTRQRHFHALHDVWNFGRETCMRDGIHLRHNWAGKHVLVRYLARRTRGQHVTRQLRFLANMNEWDSFTLLRGM